MQSCAKIEIVNFPFSFFSYPQMHFIVSCAILSSEFSKKQVEFKGLSGQIEFKEGQRNFFKLDLMKLKQNFFVKCGEWSPPHGLNITDYEALFEGK